MTKASRELELKLGRLGLSDNEVGVYLAIIGLGKGTASKIARRAGILRTTAYAVLDGLINKGLVSLSAKEPKEEYAAEAPEELEKYLEKRVRESQGLLEKSKSLIPQLRTVYEKAARPKVMFYEGVEGLEHVYEDTLTAKEPIRAYANVDEMHKALPRYFPKYYQRRTVRNIPIRAIFPANEAGFEREHKDFSEARESALVPPGKFYFSPEINIYNNKIMIASWKEKLGIIIESAEIADAMKKIFELAWAEAKRLDKEIRVKRGLRY
jgi:sugar-specific transcriptional regulator TrmB